MVEAVAQTRATRAVKKVGLPAIPIALRSTKEKMKTEASELCLRQVLAEKSMSAIPTFKPREPQIIETKQHTVRRYIGDPHQIIDKMIAEKRTGMLLIHLSQGSIFKQLFDSRPRETEKFD